MPWEIYKRTGKSDIVHEHYGATRAYAEFLTRNAPGSMPGLVNASTILYLQASTGDWCCCDVLPHCGDESGGGRCNVNCPKAAASAFAHILAVSRVADLAAVVGNAADVAKFKAQLKVMKAEYHRLFFDEHAGAYAERCSTKPASVSGCGMAGKTLNGTVQQIQSEQVMPLYLGLVPPQHVASVVAALVKVREHYACLPHCGILS